MSGFKHFSEIEIHGDSKFLSITIVGKNNLQIKISAIYRCHTLNKTNFIKNMKNFLDNNKNKNNHFIVGDFNIDLINPDEVGELFLNNFLSKEYFH